MKSIEILNILDEYWPSISFAKVREFKPSVGFKGDDRRIDLWVIERAPAKGMPAHSVEIKISRSDWLRELKQPLKARLALAISNYMWVAAPINIVKPEELPLGWGLIEINPERNNLWERIKVIHPAEYRDKVRPTWGLVASLIRGLVKTANLEEENNDK